MAPSTMDTKDRQKDEMTEVRRLKNKGRQRYKGYCTGDGCSQVAIEQRERSECGKSTKTYKARMNSKLPPQTAPRMHPAQERRPPAKFPKPTDPGDRFAAGRSEQALRA